MKTTIDAAGRLVIPKAVRDEAGLTGRREVEVAVRDGRIEIEPVSAPIRLAERGGVLVAETDSPLPPLTTREVRDILERVRR